MLIPEAETFVFAAGLLAGAGATLFIRFLIGLLYKLNSLNSEHLTADEVDFDESEECRPHWPSQTRLENTSVYPRQARQSH